MQHPLLSQVRSVARQARMLQVVYGLGWFLIWTLAAAFALGLLDYLLRFQDRGVRLICSAALAAACVWGFRRFLQPSWRRHFSDVEVAQRVEQCFPQLEGRFSSSVEFLRHDHQQPTADSPVLRSAVISEAEELVGRLDLFACLDRTSTRRVLAALLPVVLLVAAVCAIDFDSASRAMRRLAIPWSNETWPRWNALEFTQAPRRIAAGQDFAVAVVDRHGRLPADITMQYWPEGDSEREVESRSMRVEDGRALHVRRNVTRPFRYRAVGGDDQSMEWLSLEVVAAPTVESLAIRVHAPAYTGIAESRVAADAVRVVEGSLFSLQGRASHPVATVTMHLEIDQRKTAIPAQLESDGRTFTITDRPVGDVGSGRYWLELVESDGVVGGQETRGSWQVVADAPPTVTLLAPAPDAAFTPDAAIPMRVKVTDDLAVRDLVLRFHDESHPLYSGPESPPPRRALPSEPEIREVEHVWDFNALGLQASDVVEFQLIASDYRPQSQTQVLSFSIISAAEFDYRVQERLRALLRQLQEALRQQRATRNQIDGLATQLDQVGAFQPQDIALLQSCELEQRQIEHVLGTQPGGATAILTEALTELETGRLTTSNLVGQLTETSRQLAVVTGILLPSLRDQLFRSAKEASANAANQAVVRPLLAGVEHGQDEVIEILTLLVGQLAQWDDFRRLSRDLARVLQEQREISRHRDQQATLGRRWEDLSAQEQADLQRLARSQVELAQRFDRWRGDLASLRSQMQSTDPEAAEKLAEASRAAGQSQIAERMRASAANLSQNRLSTAAEAAQQAEQSLEQLLGAMSGRGAAAANSTVGRQLERQLSRMKEAQTTLANETARQQSQESSPTRDAALEELGRQQTELAGEAAQANEQLNPPPVFRFGLDAAAQMMRQAGERLQQRLTDEESLALQRGALQKLQQLLDALQAAPPVAAQTPPPTDSSPDSESSSPRAGGGSHSPAELQLLHAMQLEINERTVFLDARRGTASEGDAVDRELQHLASDQNALAELARPQATGETASQGDVHTQPPARTDDDLDRALQELGISDLGADAASNASPGRQTPRPAAGEDLGQTSAKDPLHGISEEMREAGRRLQDRDTSASTQSIQQRIAAELKRLLRDSQTPAAGQADPQDASEQTAGNREGVPGSTAAEAASDVLPTALEAVWGSLPDRIRQQIQSPLREEFLPRYRTVIEEYYRRLAEEQQRLKR